MIFYADYSYQRGRWGEYGGSWCDRCYVAAEDVTFPITRLVIEGGFDLFLEVDKYMHLEASNGDHLLVLFQSDINYFRNLTNRNPALCKGKID